MLDDICEIHETEFQKKSNTTGIVKDKKTIIYI